MGKGSTSSQCHGSQYVGRRKCLQRDPRQLAVVPFARRRRFPLAANPSHFSSVCRVRSTITTTPGQNRNPPGVLCDTKGTWPRETNPGRQLLVGATGAYCGTHSHGKVRGQWVIAILLVGLACLFAIMGAFVELEPDMPPDWGGGR